MFRKLIPLAVLIVLFLGCKKKTADTEGGAGDGKTDSDPSATFTLKFRDEQAGDKTEHATTETSTTEIGTDGKSEKQKQDKKLEYTEHIIDMPAGAAKATKLTRAYKVAQGFDKKAGAMKTFPYEGKAVSIEKKGAFYEFTADGKRMDSKDATDLSREFSSQSKSSDDELLPKKPVKVGESWTVDLVALKRLSGNTSLPIDMPKSKLTAKLTRAYTRDGKQWGGHRYRLRSGDRFECGRDGKGGPDGRGHDEGDDNARPRDRRFRPRRHDDHEHEDGHDGQGGRPRGEGRRRHGLDEDDQDAEVTVRAAGPVCASGHLGRLRRKALVKWRISKMANWPP